VKTLHHVHIVYIAEEKKEFDPIASLVRPNYLRKQLGEGAPRSSDAKRKGAGAPSLRRSSKKNDSPGGGGGNVLELVGGVWTIHGRLTQWVERRTVYIKTVNW